MNVLVTGATGAIGSWVVRELAERGHTPVLFDSRDDWSLLADLQGAVRLVVGDVRDLAALLHAAHDGRVEAVIHLAAVIQAQRDMPLASAVNVGGTLNVLEAARLAGLGRVVVMSTKSVYGTIVGEHAHPTYRPMSEDQAVRPLDAYGVTKFCAEGLALQYEREHGVDVVALRLASTYGPGKTRHGAYAFLPGLIESAYDGRAFRAEQGLQQGNDVIYNRDVAGAIVAALEARRPRRRVYNVGTGRAVMLEEFLTALRRMRPNADLEVGSGLDYQRSGLNNYCVLDVSRAAEDLDWRARYDVAAALKDYFAFLERGGR